MKHGQDRPDLLRQAHRIQVISRKVVDELLGGEYKSVFKGRGMEFDEVREYQPGDEVRTIDWNVTARTGTPYIKRYVEEREQVLFFLVDLSASGAFSSAEKTKNDIAAELCGILAFSAIKNHDRVGLILFTDRIELFVPPDKGQHHVFHIIREVLRFTPGSKGTDIACALDYLGTVVRKRCVTFLITDFQDAGYERALKLAAHHYDLIAISISDPLELELPNAGLVRMLDAETGEQLVLDTASASLRRRFRAAGQARLLEQREALTRLDIDQIELRTDQDYLRKLVHFFRARGRRQTL